jgi:hypothetical protein
MKEDGGTVFPYFRASQRFMESDVYGTAITPEIDERGMSLRDYFAAAALTQRGKEWGEDGHGYADIARYCYSQADAMLTERKK